MTALVGRDLDRAIAQARGDWKCSSECRGEGHFIPAYSTDPALMLMLLEEIPRLTIYRREDGSWAVTTWGQPDSTVYAPTLPEAVARAWLAWHEATKSPAG